MGRYDGDNYGDIIEGFGARELNINWLATLNEQNRGIGIIHLTVLNL
jgi:hypothetical protein